MAARRVPMSLLVASLALASALGCGKKDGPTEPNACADPAPPATPGGLTPTPASGRIALAWTNPPDSDFVGVRLLRRAGVAPASHHDLAATLVYEGSGQAATDSGLSNGVVYHYAIWAFDACDPANYSSAPMTTFASPASVAPPPPPTGAVAEHGVHQLTVHWTNPVSTYFTGVVVRRKPNGVPTGPADGTLVYTGPGTQVVDTNSGAGLTPGVTYCYAIFSRDSYGQFSTSAATVCSVPDYEFQVFEIPTLTMSAQWPGSRCGGDCDFATGPVVTLTAEVQRTGPNFFVQIAQFRAAESDGDLTCIERGPLQTWKTNNWPMPDGWTFVGYVTPPIDTLSYADDDLDVDTILGRNVVDAVQILGATADGDACEVVPGEDLTHIVTLSTRTIQVRLRR